MSLPWTLPGVRHALHKSAWEKESSTSVEPARTFGVSLSAFQANVIFYGPECKARSRAVPQRQEGTERPWRGEEENGDTFPQTVPHLEPLPLDGSLTTSTSLVRPCQPPGAVTLSPHPDLSLNTTALSNSPLESTVFVFNRLLHQNVDREGGNPRLPVPCTQSYKSLLAARTNQCVSLFPLINSST